MREKSSTRIHLQKLIANGINSLQLKKYQDAVNYAHQAIKLDSKSIQAKELMAYGFANLGEIEKAIDLLRSIVADKCVSSATLYEYGSLLLLAGYDKEAKSVLERALELNPSTFEILHDLGTANAKLGFWEKALEIYELAVRINMNSAELFFNVGRVHDELFREEKAIACYQKCLDLDPFFVGALINMGIDLSILKRYKESLACYRRALAIDPQQDFLYGNIIQIKMYLSIWSEREEELLELNKGIEEGLAIVTPFTMLALTDDLTLQKKAAELYVEKKYKDNIPYRHFVYQNSEKIKVAYFSGDFGDHPVGHLMVELLELHDHSQYEVFAFSYGRNDAGEINKRIRNAVDEFIDISGGTDRFIVDLALSKGIDIAVDLSGYTQHSRTQIFLNRVAPIQVSYLGYIGTMGANFIDYIIADKVVIPAENQKHFSEKIIYLPDCFQPSDRQRTISQKKFTRSDFNLPNSGTIFCCFNNNFKLSPDLFSSWMRILRGVKDSVLWIYSSNSDTVANLKIEALKRGVDPSRLIFAEVAANEKYLAQYQLADLFLDTFPYNAGTTANDALWVGLPVLTRMGSSMASRMAASLLRTLGLEELITESIEAYEGAAIELGNHPERINKIRQKLEKNKLCSPLFNTPVFTRNLEKAFRQIYERHHSGFSPDHIRLS